MAGINRVLSKPNLDLFVSDFDNLIKIVNSSQGELDISIRDNYLNIYYKGNSLAKISFKLPDQYKIDIHNKFFKGTNADNPDFFDAKTVSQYYTSLILSPKKPPLRFLQKKHINQFCSKIKKENHGEEIDFEQALITDNLERDDLIIIDRQITDKALSRKRMDLLVLKQTKAKSIKYHFLVIEVKLGNNPELKNDVAMQVDTYVKHIERHFNDYKKCYEMQFKQKKTLGLLNAHSFDSIEIEKPTKGLVVVGGYSKIAHGSISTLKATFPKLEIKQFEYKL